MIISCLQRRLKYKWNVQFIGMRMVAGQRSYNRSRLWLREDVLPKTQKKCSHQDIICLTTGHHRAKISFWYGWEVPGSAAKRVDRRTRLGSQARTLTVWCGWCCPVNTFWLLLLSHFLRKVSTEPGKVKQSNGLKHFEPRCKKCRWHNILFR